MELETRLIEGFDFTCRPGCGLCCFTTPRVDDREAAHLRQAVPSAPLIELADGEVGIESRPYGGACQFLSGSRCGIRRLRPSPCRIFPITVHLGFRAQASVVLTCPGISLEPLAGPRPYPRGGLESELEAARARLELEGAERLARYRAEFDARGASRGFPGPAEAEAGALRSRLHPWVDALDPQTVTTGEIPSVSEGLEQLPLAPSPTAGPFALGRQGPRWLLLELHAEGEPPEVRASARRPGRSLPLTADADRLWRRYLHYWVERDALFGIVEAAIAPADTLEFEQGLRAALEEIAGEVLDRGGFLAKSFGGTEGRLDVPAISQGIRATDMDLLDRPTTGERL
ncbi:MAG: YkgJ family cysteine cluster protein [Thermoplasmata archaeon]|jgi:Fe-S-cluster containining protein